MHSPHRCAPPTRSAERHPPHNETPKVSQSKEEMHRRMNTKEERRPLLPPRPAADLHVSSCCHPPPHSPLPAPQVLLVRVVMGYAWPTSVQMGPGPHVPFFSLHCRCTRSPSLYPCILCGFTPTTLRRTAAPLAKDRQPHTTASKVNNNNKGVLIRISQKKSTMYTHNEFRRHRGSARSAGVPAIPFDPHVYISACGSHLRSVFFCFA